MLHALKTTLAQAVVALFMVGVVAGLAVGLVGTGLLVGDAPFVLTLIGLMWLLTWARIKAHYRTRNVQAKRKS